MKKTIAITLALVLALSLAACSGGGSLPGIDTSVKVGSKVSLGDIEWIILAVEDNKALLLSRESVEKRAYHSENVDMTWEHSDIRAYLNGEFYDNTFSGQEKKKMLVTQLENNDNAKHGINGGNETKDRIFLLSIDEVEKYMGSNAHTNVVSARIISRDWFLRSPGYKSNYAAIVDIRELYGRIDDRRVDSDIGNIRPALWINLK